MPNPDSKGPTTRFPVVSSVSNIDLSDMEIGVGGGDAYIAELAQKLAEEARRNNIDGEDAKPKEIIHSPRRVEIPKGPPYQYNNS